ncbi:MAG: hypothetical protein ACK50S_01110, partial [bacterium]
DVVVRIVKQLGRFTTDLARRNPRDRSPPEGGHRTRWRSTAHHSPDLGDFLLLPVGRQLPQEGFVLVLRLDVGCLRHI